MRAWLIALFLALFPSYALAGDNPAGQQLLDDAAKLIHIQGPGKAPFQMEVDFQAQISIPHQGHLTVQWASNDLWYWDLKMEDYREIQVRRGEMVYTKRNAPFTPLALTRLQNLLGVFQVDSRRWEVQKIKPNNGLSCVQLKSRLSHSHGEICLEPDSKHVMSTEFTGDDYGRKQVFSEYQPFHDNSYPRELNYFEHGSQVLRLTIVSLNDKSLEDSVFMPPQNSVARRKCENLVQAIPVKQPRPPYPPSDVQNLMSGTTIVALTVQEDGSVSDVQIVQTAEHEMDRQTVETVKTWKFKPAMCGNDPVASDITVEVNFRPSQ
jgi:TonB family protein